MSDRWEHRNGILWIQIISALSVLTLPLLVSYETIQVWHIFVLGAITSTSRGSATGSWIVMKRSIN